jgi:hypothetical protein
MAMFTHTLYCITTAFSEQEAATKLNIYLTQTHDISPINISHTWIEKYGKRPFWKN